MGLEPLRRPTGRRQSTDEGDTVRVSDALRHEGTAGSPRERLREVQLWLLVVAHLSIGMIDGAGFAGTLLGVPTQVVFENAVFTVAMVLVVVLISYVARLSTLAKATIFMSPFSPERESGHWEE